MTSSGGEAHQMISVTRRGVDVDAVGYVKRNLAFRRQEN